MVANRYTYRFILVSLVLGSFGDAIPMSMSNDGGRPWSMGLDCECSDPLPTSCSTNPVSSLLSVNTITGVRKLAYCYTKGKSPGVLFCNGFQSSMQGTKAVNLENYCRQLGVAFCRFDYRGHGDSSSESEEFTNCTLSDWVQDASTVLETVMNDQEKVVVIGSSMGGWIACHLAMQHPQKVVSLLGIASAPDFLEDIFQKLSPLQQDQWKKDGFLSLPTEYFPVPYRVSWKLVEDARQKWNILKGPDGKTSIPIQCSVHLVHGKLDKDIPWTKSLDLMECLETNDVTLSIIKDGDHRLSRPQDLQRIRVVLGEILQRHTVDDFHNDC